MRFFCDVNVQALYYFELNYDIVLIWASRYLDLFFVGAIF